MQSTPTPTLRKQKTESLLTDLSFSINEKLPVKVDETEAVLRTPQEIAKRILGFAYLGLFAGDDEADVEEIIEYLKEETIWEVLSNREKEYFIKAELTESDKISISWRSECMFILLWVLNKIEKQEWPINECNISDCLNLLPEYLEPANAFIENASLRSITEILDETDLLFRLNWSIKEKAESTLKPTIKVNPGVVQEWQQTLSWVIYKNVDWDDVSTIPGIKMVK